MMTRAVSERIERGDAIEQGFERACRDAAPASPIDNADPCERHPLSHDER